MYVGWGSKVQQHTQPGKGSVKGMGSITRERHPGILQCSLALQAG